MKIKLLFPILVLLTINLTTLPLAHTKDRIPADGPEVSGHLVGGFRILSILSAPSSNTFTVYRGDYVKFEIDPDTPSPLLTIAELNIEEPLSGNLAETPYIKMKQTGAFPYQIGNVSGTINVIAYNQANYREVTAEQAVKAIVDEKPLILDVRTPNEFKAGHLDQALLIPVQQLTSRLDKIAAHKDRPILVYCATGNRSTVASKILIDNGFKRVVNLRYGIYDWARRGQTVVK